MRIQSARLLLLFLFFVLQAAAQEKSPIKFGKISPEDFKTTVYSIDTSAGAVVLGDIGFSYFEGNSDGWFTFFHKWHRRVHILRKNGYDAANVEFNLYVDGGYKEELQSVRAVTYNLENGKVVETKLENKNIFRDKLDKNHNVNKFTLPNVKEGSIIEFTCTIKSDFLRHPTTWYFQGEYPVLWSELQFQVPEFLNYVFIAEGYQQFYNKKPPETATHSFAVTYESMEAGSTMKREQIKFQAQVIKYRWVMKDVPALKLESFTSSLHNHIARIEFQLKEYREPLQYRPIMQSWQMLTRDLLEMEHFGLHLDKSNNWIDDDLKNIIQEAKTENEKAKLIYEFLQNNFTCTGYNAVFMDQVLKNVYKTRKGNVAEINLLLVAMLKRAGIKSEPVLLSTRRHGYAYALYPLIEKFNYVIAVAEIGGKNIYLDATRNRLGFGRLVPDCYNGHAIMVNTEATPLHFSTDSLLEQKLTSVFITMDEKGNLNGRFQQTPGIYEAYRLREEVNEKGQDEFFNKLEKAYTIDVEIENKKIDSLKKQDEPLVLNYDFSIPSGQDDIIYFNPMMAEGYKENPFKSAARLYPVEMPYTFDEIYVFRMEVPGGYSVDELPKSVRVNFDDAGTSYFEYLIAEREGSISLRSRIKMTRSYFLQEEHEILREFYAFIVKKHGEQIVFKKKK